jgi:translation elongation factor EF-1alpha
MSASAPELDAEIESLQPTHDLIDLLAVAILLVNAVSVAGVVGGGVSTGAFAVETSQQPQQQAQDTAAVDTGQTNTGQTSVSWTEPGDAIQLEIRDSQGNTIDTLRVVGQETTITADEFTVYARYTDGTTEQVYSEGG